MSTPSMSVRFRVGFLVFAEAVDVSDDMQILIELNSGSEGAARRTWAVEQAG